MKTTAILIPTYKRFDALINTLQNTPVDAHSKFIIIANLEDSEFLHIQENYSNKSIIIDERKIGKLGGCKAYNLAFEIAKQNNFDYAVLFADDVIPFKKNWLNSLNKEFITKNEKFGIFSTDEGHIGHYGYNFILDCPIAHFFIIDCKLCDQLFSDNYKQYVIDFEIAVRLQEKGIDIKLLPIKLNHLRSGLHREFMDVNYSEDAKTFLKAYPRYEIPFKDQSNSYLIKQSNKSQFVSQVDISKLQLWCDLKTRESILSKSKRKIKSVLLPVYRKLIN